MDLAEVSTYTIYYVKYIHKYIVFFSVVFINYYYMY